MRLTLPVLFSLGSCGDVTGIMRNADMDDGNKPGVEYTDVSAAKEQPIRLASPSKMPVLKSVQNECTSSEIRRLLKCPLQIVTQMITRLLVSGRTKEKKQKERTREVSVGTERAHTKSCSKAQSSRDAALQ